MRLIDKDDLLRDMRKCKEFGELSAKSAIRKVEACPTVDAVPVRHGHWINHYDDLFPEESTKECSVCHAEQMATMLNDNYCPNCGAKMESRK